MVLGIIRIQQLLFSGFRLNSISKIFRPDFLRELTGDVPPPTIDALIPLYCTTKLSNRSCAQLLYAKQGLSHAQDGEQIRLPSTPL